MSTLGLPGRRNGEGPFDNRAPTPADLVGFGTLPIRRLPWTERVHLARHGAIWLFDEGIPAD
jgi:hypothetical protein